jgi:methylmalonyl-CoA/ethylmalonyl-CoA epimerase
MVLDHIGIVVKSIKEGILHWESFFGYRQATEIVTNTRQNVHVVFMEKRNSMTVKLVAPVDDASPVSAYAKKGGGLHHLCFRCVSIESELGRLSSLGAHVIMPPQPGEAFENEKISFVFCRMGLNVELIETDKRASRLIKSST